MIDGAPRPNLQNEEKEACLLLDSGHTLASHRPISCTNLTSCCDLSASCCSRFHSPHSGCQLIPQRRRVSTPDKSRCLSLSVTQRQIIPQLVDGMLLQDIFKRLAVDWMTVQLSCPFVFPPTVPQAVLPPAGPACTFGSVGLRVSGRVAEDHQDGALRRQFPAGWPQHSGSAGPDQHTVSFCLSHFLSV